MEVEGMSLRRFFTRQLPLNRRRAAIAERREEQERLRQQRIENAAREERQRIINLNREFNEIDHILAGDQVMEWDLGEEFVHDAQSWMDMQAMDKFNKRRVDSDTLEEEEYEARRTRKWLRSVEDRYMGYRPNTMGAGDYVYTGASVVEGVNIPGVNIPGTTGPQESAPVPMSYDGVPLSGPPLPSDIGGIDMVEVEIDPILAVIDETSEKVAAEVVPIAVENPFSKDNYSKMLKKTRQSPFSWFTKKKR